MKTAANATTHVFIALTLLGFSLSPDAEASARKILKYQIDHTKLEGYLAGKHAEEPVISIFPLASGGAAAIVQGGSVRPPSTPLATPTPPSPAFISLFDAQGSLEQTGLLPVQIVRQDCRVECARLSIVVSSMQGESHHHYVSIDKSHDGLRTHYDYILDAGTEGKLSWVLLGSQHDSLESATQAIPKPQALHFNRREPTLYLETDTSQKRTRIYMLDLQ